MIPLRRFSFRERVINVTLRTFRHEERRTIVLCERDILLEAEWKVRLVWIRSVIIWTSIPMPHVCNEPASKRHDIALGLRHFQRRLTRPPPSTDERLWAPDVPQEII